MLLRTAHVIDQELRLICTCVGQVQGDAAVPAGGLNVGAAVIQDFEPVRPQPYVRLLVGRGELAQVEILDGRLVVVLGTREHGRCQARGTGEGSVSGLEDGERTDAADLVRHVEEIEVPPLGVPGEPRRSLVVLEVIRVALERGGPRCRAKNPGRDHFGGAVNLLRLIVEQLSNEGDVFQHSPLLVTPTGKRSPGPVWV
jgi:hypothetical protein